MYGMYGNMGMTDKQFNGFVRFLLDDLIEAEENFEKKPEKTKKENFESN
jgi:hypothetical protein